MLRWNVRRLAASRLTSIKSVSSRPFSKKSNNSNSVPSRDRPSLSQRILNFPRGTIKSPYGSAVQKSWHIALGIFSFGIGFHVFANYVGTCDETWGISMLPTFNASGDYVFVSKWYRRGRGIHVGDVVSFKNPIKEGEHAIKRVIGLEGDFVLMNTPEKSEAMIQVPQGHCWVVGDNLKHSRDSRIWGPLPLALISGKVMAKWSVLQRQRGFNMVEHGLQPSAGFEDLD